MRAASLVALALAWWIAALLGPASVRADEAALRARLAALGTLAEAETDLADAARAALDRESSDRARGDEAAATRAERIAEASIALLERRRAHADAESRLHAAEAERDAMRARLEEARSAAASDAHERARLDPGGPSP